jgi:hypothetical protein
MTAYYVQEENALASVPSILTMSTSPPIEITLDV